MLKRNWFFIVPFVVLVFVAQTTYASNQKKPSIIVHGTVRDATTKEPLAGVAVMVSHTMADVPITDKNGKYIYRAKVVSNSNNGYEAYAWSNGGYEPSPSIPVKLEKDTKVDFYLQTSKPTPDYMKLVYPTEKTLVKSKDGSTKIMGKIINADNGKAITNMAVIPVAGSESAQTNNYGNYMLNRHDIRGSSRLYLISTNYSQKFEEQYNYYQVNVPLGYTLKLNFKVHLQNE